MIKRLRKRFIKIATLAVAAVLFVLALSVNIANFISINSDLNRTLRLITDNRGIIPHNPPEGKPGTEPNGHFDMETPFSTRYFVLRYNSSGELTGADLDKIAAVTEDDTDSYLAAALKHGAGNGFFGGYKYSVIKTEKDKYMAVFLDAHRELRSAAVTAVLSCGATLVCIALVCIIVVLCSKRAIAPVIKASEQQKQFITDAGHELKTPITVISTSIKLLEMETGENKWIDKVRFQTEKLTELVNSLVALSRMDEEASPLHMAEFDMGAALRETAESFGDFAEANGHRLQIDIPQTLIYCGDEYAVRQLASILLDNAVKYAVSGTDILISAQKAKKGVRVVTQNECEGISKEQLDRLFDRFYRADQSRGGATRGFGIGLSIARSIAEGHNGSIKAESADGKTVVFTAELR